MHTISERKKRARTGESIAEPRNGQSTLLLLGSMDDLLVRSVASELHSRKTRFASIGEEELFSGSSMEYERTGRKIKGRVGTGSKAVSLNGISGVLSRLPRTWWPNSFPDLQDQMFVYHETTAAWYNFLAFLHSPVINRFPLGWWLQDLNFTLILAKKFSAAVGVPLAPIELASNYNVRLVPTGPRKEPDLGSIYLAGKTLIPGHRSMKRIAQRLDLQRRELEGWQRDSGIGLCRLDFRKNSLVSVEAFPLFEEEQEITTRQVASAVAGIFV